jgi:DNA-binding winged helix-turn-helix (wHTH) protein/tetratricopeptide (TPR) repeat protein
MPEKPRTSVVRFGNYQLNLQSGELQKHGIRLRLPGQSLKILATLLERPGEIVTREELQKTLWPEDTFVDFEHSVNSAVKRLREALNDSADNPRFVETLPRLGYRYIGPPVARLEGPSASETAPAAVFPAEISSPEEKTASAAGSAAVIRVSAIREEVRATPPTLGTRAMVATVSLILLAVAGYFLQQSRMRPVLTETDLVLVSDFVNTTGDPVFDGSLKRALAVKLGESPHFNLLNEPNLRAALHLMERPTNERLVPPVDREVCQRAGAKVAIEGSIFALGNQYVITMDGRNCLTGDSVAHQERRAPNRDQVLSTLGDMIPPFRRRLGESLATIQRFNTPIAQATTPSLSALKAYTMGDEARLQDKEEESVGFYRMAVELDPNFAIAYARLGALYRNLAYYDLSRQNMETAFQLREHVTEKEKFYIAAHYYVDSTYEIEKAIQTYELWTQTYPRDWIPYNNLADVASRSGLIDKAIPAAQEALRLNPNSWFAYAALAKAYLMASRFAEAKAVCERAIAENHVGSFSNILVRIAYVEGDQAAIDQQIAAAKGKSNEAVVLSFAGQATTGLGKLRAARQLFELAENIALQRDQNETASNSAYDESLPEAELGDVSGARSHVEKAVRWNPDNASQAFAAITLARVGDARRAERFVKAASVRPLDTLHNAVVLATARAAIQLDRKNPGRAIEELKAAIPYDLSENSSGSTLYLRGVAYLQAGSPKEAAAQFQKLIDNHGSAVTVYWALAHLGLARAHASDGERDKAQEKYREFFALWKDADPDIPILIAAKSEYAKLQ